MIVGAEHIHGGPRHHDYDELLEMSGEPNPTALSRQPAPQLPPAPTHGPPPHPQHAPPQHHPHHHHHHRHHENGYNPYPYEHERPMPHYEEQHHHMQHPQQHQPARKRLVAEEPTHERQFPVGFMFENIPPGGEADIEVKPQVYFRGERLAIPPTIARYFDILDIKVGKDSQLAATGTMPGESFSALAVGVRMELDTAKPGIVITIRVRNVDTAPHDFKAVMYGAVLE
jgi:hypothetical protein